MICRLDASEHEELARRQLITVSQARADHQRAELDLGAASTGLREYRGGRYRLQKQGFEGRIALARAQVAQLTDRLDWLRRMLARRYISRAQIAGEVSMLEKSSLAQSRAETEFRTFEEFESPRQTMELESHVASARSNLMYQSVRLRAAEARLVELTRQVELCTMRAPHDGILIYAHKPKRGVRIEAGMPVRQRQELFYLPDLSRMEVQVLLHETVVARSGRGCALASGWRAPPTLLMGSWRSSTRCRSRIGASGPAVRSRITWDGFRSIRRAAS